MSASLPWPEARAGNQAFTNAAVVVIGAGVSGMCVGIDLLKRGITNFVIVEKSGGIGGTWRDNKYPGCACDVWSLLYSYSFAQRSDWTRLYPGQEEILDYLTGIAQEYDLYKYIRFNTSVESANWDDKTSRWTTLLQVAAGKDAEFNKDYEIHSDFLVSAVGQLNQPSWPQIEGLDDFQGKTMHSARWDWSYDLTGKRIGVIGNGATAVQIIPELAKVASKLTIFQRTPNWVVNRLDQPVSPTQRTLFKWVPPLRWMTRSRMMDYRESVYDAVVNPEGYFSNLFRTQCTEGINANIKDEALRKSLLPQYSPLCKRVIISDEFYPTLARPNVVLETRRIAKVAHKGVRIDDGTVEGIEEELDLLVCATGFKAAQFLHPIKITGRNGRKLDDVWAGGAKALYGICVEDMPNFAMLYGPNTNLGHNSVILMIEAQTRWINTLIWQILSSRPSPLSHSISCPFSLSPKPGRIAEYNEALQRKLKDSVFADPNCSSWYKDPQTGLITNNWSDTVVAYQELLAKVDWADFEGAEELVADGKAVKWIGRVREESWTGLEKMAVLSVVGAAVGAAAIAVRKRGLPKSLRFL